MKRYLLLLIACLLVSTPAFATFGHNNDPDTTAEADADANAEANADADARAYADGGEADADASSSSGGNVLSSVVNNKRPGNISMSSGNSTSEHQKVRVISGGWLTGSAGIRWDATDKELRILERSDILRDRGQVAAADELECSAKVIYKALGGDPDSCYTLLASSNTDVNRTSYNRRYEQQMEDMQRQIDILEEQTADCSKTANRVLQKCASK